MDDQDQRRDNGPPEGMSEEELAKHPNWRRYTKSYQANFKKDPGNWEALYTSNIEPLDPVPQEQLFESYRARIRPAAKSGSGKWLGKE